MTSPAELRCLVLNAGGRTHPDKAAAIDWVRRVLADPAARPHLMFVQEVPSDDWLSAWEASGYRAVFGHPRGWAVRSAVLTSLPPSECVGLTVETIPELEYHGEYVAAASLVGWAPGERDLSLLSVHASPAPATDEYLQKHPERDRLTPRLGGTDTRYAGRLFDADVVLDTIASQRPFVLACGDLNEARGWDTAPGHKGHTWGAEYFGAPDEDGRLVGGAMQRRGLVDVPLGRGADEVITRRAPGHPRLQLDHIVATEDIARLIDRVAVDDAWTEGTDAADGLADHSPIRFVLRRPD